MGGIPATFTLTELAAMLGFERHQVENLVKSGELRTVRFGAKKRGSPHRVPLTVVRDTWPEIWESIILRAQLTTADGENADHE